MVVIGGAHSAPPKACAQSREAAISPREARKIFLRVLFSDQEALSLDMFPDAKKIGQVTDVWGCQLPSSDHRRRITTTWNAYRTAFDHCRTLRIAYR